MNVRKAALREERLNVADERYGVLVWAVTSFFHVRGLLAHAVEPLREMSGAHGSQAREILFSTV